MKTLMHQAFGHEQHIYIHTCTLSLSLSPRLFKNEEPLSRKGVYKNTNFHRPIKNRPVAAGLQRSEKANFPGQKIPSVPNIEHSQTMCFANLPSSLYQEELKGPSILFTVSRCENTIEYTMPPPPAPPFRPSVCRETEAVRRRDGTFYNILTPAQSEMYGCCF
jgi:hypothetical protein